MVSFAATRPRRPVWSSIFDLRKAEAVARYGEGAVDQELPLADKLRRDGERSRKAAPVFNTAKGQPKEEPKEKEAGPLKTCGEVF